MRCGPVADTVKVLKALSSEPRLEMLGLLKRRTLCVGAISAKLGMTQSAVSQHLRILREAGLVTSQKRANWMHYSIVPRALRRHRESISRLLDADE